MKIIYEETAPNKPLQLTAAAFGLLSVNRQTALFGLSDVFRKLSPQLNFGRYPWRGRSLLSL